MGLGIGHLSSSSYDDKKSSKVEHVVKIVHENLNKLEDDNHKNLRKWRKDFKELCKLVTEEIEKKKKKYPNPDPKNFEIQDTVMINGFLIVLVNYPDCTNFEGNKILVYKNTTLTSLVKQGSLDPHFSSNSKFHSPVARFEPTLEGWYMAECLCNNFIHGKTNNK